MSVQQYIDEYLVHSKDFNNSLTPEVLYSDYLEFCEDTFEEPISIEEFNEVICKHFSRFGNGNGITKFNKIETNWI